MVLLSPGTMKTCLYVDLSKNVKRYIPSRWPTGQFRIYKFIPGSDAWVYKTKEIILSFKDK